MRPYEGDDDFPETVDILDDGDPRQAGTLNVPHEGALDRTRWLKLRLAEDILDLADLRNNGFIEGFPKLKAGNSARSIQEFQPLFYNEQNGTAEGGDNDFSTYGSIFAGGTTADVSQSVIYVPIRKLHVGATLAGVTLMFDTSAVAHGAIPDDAHIMRLEVLRRMVDVGAIARPSYADASLSSTGYAIPNTLAYTLPEWNDVGPKAIAFTADQNNACDAQSQFFAIISDEYGPDSKAGNRYLGMIITWNLVEVRP